MASLRLFLDPFSALFGFPDLSCFIVLVPSTTQRVVIRWKIHLQAGLNHPLGGAGCSCYICAGPCGERPELAGAEWNPWGRQLKIRYFTTGVLKMDSYCMLLLGPITSRFFEDSTCLCFKLLWNPDFLKPRLLATQL